VAGRIRDHIRSNIYGLVAVFIALGGTTYAATQLPKNSVGAKQIKPKAVGTSEARDNAFTGQDVNEATLGQVPSAQSAVSAQSANGAQTATSAESANTASSAHNADLLDNLNSTDFLRSNAKAADADKLDGTDSSAFAQVGSEGWHEVGAPGQPPFNDGSAGGFPPGGTCSWGNFDANHNSAAFLRDRFGFVHLKGMVDADDGTNAPCGAAFAGQPDARIFNLPPGYRPAKRGVNVTVTNETLGRVDVDGPELSITWGAGAVFINPPTTFANAEQWISLDGITFRCAPSGVNGCP
jgi:hypothetical protein